MRLNHLKIRFQNKRIILKSPRLRPLNGGADQVLCGIEVRENGDEVLPRGADERLWIVERKLITGAWGMVFNKQYALLEPLRLGDWDFCAMYLEQGFPHSDRLSKWTTDPLEAFAQCIRLHDKRPFVETFVSYLEHGNQAQHDADKKEWLRAKRERESKNGFNL